MHIHRWLMLISPLTLFLYLQQFTRKDDWCGDKSSKKWRSCSGNVLNPALLTIFFLSPYACLTLLDNLNLFVSLHSSKNFICKAIHSYLLMRWDSLHYIMRHVMVTKISWGSWLHMRPIQLSTWLIMRRDRRHSTKQLPWKNEAFVTC